MLNFHVLKNKVETTVWYLKSGKIPN